MSRIKDLIACHDSYQIISLWQIDNIMSPSRNHIDCFYLISWNLKFYSFPCINITFLDKAMTMYNNELFPLAVVPVLSFCDPGLADINADLATIYSVNQLCKKTTIITIHFHSIFLYGSSRCTPYGRTPLTELRTCGFPVSGSLRNESFTLSFVYIDIYPGSYQWIAVIQHI